MSEGVPDQSVPGWVEIQGGLRWVGAGKPAYREQPALAVRVSFTLDIDAEAWAAEYGVEDRNSIRADVKLYVEQSVRSHLAEMGLLLG